MQDTLEILITKDCGVTYQSIYKKWGIELQTLNAPNKPFSAEFIPTAQQWRTDSVNLLPYSGTGSKFQIVFRNSHNAPGNNIYLDNVTVLTEALPQTLKDKGYLVLPTVFQSQFAVWHRQPPVSLRFISVYNTMGQLIWKKEYNGNANAYIPVNISTQPSGIYFVQMGYSDKKSITERVVKF